MNPLVKGSFLVLLLPFFLFLFLFCCAHQYAHSNFDLPGVGCRPPLLLQTPLCLQATREQRQWNICGLVAVKPTVHYTKTHLIYVLWFMLKLFFLQKYFKIINQYSGITLVFVVMGILKHIEFHKQHPEFEGTYTTVL